MSSLSAVVASISIYLIIWLNLPTIEKKFGFFYSLLAFILYTIFGATIAVWGESLLTDEVFKLPSLYTLILIFAISFSFILMRLYSWTGGFFSSNNFLLGLFQLLIIALGFVGSVMLGGIFFIIMGAFTATAFITADFPVDTDTPFVIYDGILLLCAVFNLLGYAVSISGRPKGYFDKKSR